jgi:hypothetical protein
MFGKNNFLDYHLNQIRSKRQSLSVFRNPCRYDLVGLARQILTTAFLSVNIKATTGIRYNNGLSRAGVW